MRPPSPAFPALNGSVTVTRVPGWDRPIVSIRSSADMYHFQIARRRLEDLRAAVNAYHAEHVLNVVPKITLPVKADGRDRWLTRNEAARLIGAALGYAWDA